MVKQRKSPNLIRELGGLFHRNVFVIRERTFGIKMWKDSSLLTTSRDQSHY